MPKNTTSLRLADSPAQHEELDRTIIDSVRELCDFGDYERAQTLFQLLDLLTNEQYDKASRESVAFTAIQACFTYTRAFESALESEQAALNPRALRRTA